MMLAGGHAGPAEPARFRIEAEAVARLQHPNIVQIHEVGGRGLHWPELDDDQSVAGLLAGACTPVALSPSERFAAFNISDSP